MNMEQPDHLASSEDAKGLTGIEQVTPLVEGMGQRISDLADLLGGRRNLARQAGVHETQLYKYIRGGSLPGVAVCLAIASAAGVSLDWLVCGAQAGASMSTHSLLVECYPAKACPARLPWPGSIAAIEPLAVSRTELRQYDLEVSDVMAVQLQRGQACAPLSDGGTVLIDRRGPGLVGDGLYVLELAGAVRVQRLQFQCDGSLMILAISDVFRDQHVPVNRLDEVDVIGRVLWVGGWLEGV